MYMQNVVLLYSHFHTPTHYTLIPLKNNNHNDSCNADASVFCESFGVDHRSFARGAKNYVGAPNAEKPLF